MPASRCAAALVIGVALAAGGCQTSQSKVDTLKSQNRALTERSRAQLSEIENLKIHARGVEDRLIRAEQELAQLEGKRVAGGGLPGGLNAELVALAQRYPNLQYDPATGTTKLDTDVMFDSGQAELKPGSEPVLDEIANIFAAPDASRLRIMIVGHTDAKGIKGREVRDKYPNNWHLSAGRALAVADWLRKAGIPEARMGVAGYGRYQPVSSNDTAESRRHNRRVEIYVLGPETPVVGWTDSPGDSTFYR